MKSKELRTLEGAELGEKLAELKKELMKMNAQVATGTTPKSDTTSSSIASSASPLTPA